MCYVRISTYMGEEKIPTTPTQNRILDSWYLLGVLFKISDEHPRLFCMGVPPGLRVVTFLLVF